MEEMYIEQILELHRHPKNFGEAANANGSAAGYSPTCGDAITVSVRMENGKIADAKFRGEGCAISVASASLMVGYAIGKPADTVMKAGKGEINSLLGIDIWKNPARVKCAMLGLETLKNAVKNAEGKK
jgi:nitrogen fixation protein NifU and related proteins